MTFIKYDDEDEHRILKDGQRLRVPLFLMDTALQQVIAETNKSTTLHRPGPLPISDAEARQRLHDLRDTRIAQQWRVASPHAADNGAAPFVPANGPDSAPTARIARDKRIESAWR